jgi:MFS family permease
MTASQGDSPPDDLAERRYSEMGGPMQSATGWEMLKISAHKMIGVNTLVAWAFSFWASSTNTVTTLAILLERSSHISGRLNDVGMNLVLHPIDALLVFVIWISFIFGGFLASKLLDRIGFTRSLFLVAVGIGVGAFLVWNGFYAVDEDDYRIGRMIMAFILPVSMGIQNGITSMMPRIGRSTHWTGDSTDIGLALAMGDITHAVHNLIKMLGFGCGSAILGYLIGIRGIPALHGLVIIAAGFFLTTITLCWMNRALGKSPMRKR